MDWITINEALVASRFSQAEWSAFKNAAKAVSGSDVITDAIRDVVNEVRGDILSSGKYSVGAEGTMDPGLVNATLEILRSVLAARLPNAAVVFDKLRDNLLKAARDKLDLVRTGKAYVSPPTTAGADSPEPDSGDYGGEDTIDFTTIR